MKKVKFMDWPFLLFLFFAVIGPVGTKVYLFYNHALYNVPYNWMESQEKLTPQKKSDLFQDKHGMQTPTEGTLASGWLNAQVSKSFATEDLKDLYANPTQITAASLKKGAENYRIYCSICHGDLGEGGLTGKLKGGHFTPPSLHSAKLKDGSDGLIYQIIVRGQNTMPSYEKQIPADVRWDIVNYVRVLQRSQNAKEADLEAKVVDATGASKTEVKTDVKSGKEGQH
jgi:mono/diheme cytochrome c family protein